MESDHLTVIATASVKNYKSSLPTKQKKTARSGKYSESIDIIKSIPWNQIVETKVENPQIKYDSFNNTINEILDTCQPIKTITITNDQPWMTSDIKQLIATRQQLLNKNKIELKPVLSWKTKIAQVKTLPAGSTIGYGLTYKTKKKTKGST
jgi:hypothetical protein